ncbi:13251_t:CDS:1, partial [Entrophospora sp. SA101]
GIYLLEQTWQKEFYRVGQRQLGDHYFLSCDVGATFICDGYIDFYVDELNWVIKILREGKGMAEQHRGLETAGEYREIAKYAKSIAIIDICSESKKVRKLQKDFIYVSYSEDYHSFKIESLSKDTVFIRFQD